MAKSAASLTSASSSGSFVTIDGDKELNAFLRRFPDKLQRTALNKALKTGAEIVLGDARRLVPVGKEHDRPGLRLKQTLKIVRIKGKAAKNRGIGYKVVTGTRAELGIGPNEKYYYPAAVELGTKNRGDVGRRPFLRPALKNNESALMRVMRAEIKTEIRAAAKRARKKAFKEAMAD